MLNKETKSRSSTRTAKTSSSSTPKPENSVSKKDNVVSMAGTNAHAVQQLSKQHCSKPDTDSCQTQSEPKLSTTNTSTKGRAS